jgi:transglutaminase-like putative cysteine protease
MLISCVITSGCSFAADTSQITINGYTYTETQIQDAKNRVNTFQQTNNRLPSYVTISGQKIPINDFLPYIGQNSTNNEGSIGTGTTGTGTTGTGTTGTGTTGTGTTGTGTTGTGTTGTGTTGTGTTGTVINGITYTDTQIKDAVTRVNTFQQTNNRLPSYVTISGNKIPINDFLPYLEQKSNTNTNTNNNTNTNTSTTNTSGTSFSDSQINTAANTVKSFYDTNGRLPGYVTINNIQVTMPQFLQLLSFDLLNINSGVINSIILKTVTEPSNPTESITNGNLYKSEYISLAQSIKTAIEANGSIPNYLDSSLGKIRYESLIYTFSKILIYQKTNSRLPNYVSISAWSTNSSTDNSSLQQYLVATNNAQSTSPTIISLANSITAGLTTDYDKAKAIFNWVRDNISYSFYGSTQKGALGTLSSKTANCCDHSHLVVALARAAGIPARYQYGNCYYNIGGFVGWYGHVWAQLYVNGKWNYADACDNSTPFGVINAWNLNTYTLYGTYATLPF